MLAIYWTFDRPVLNLGDHLTEVFIEAFGYAFLSFESAAKNNRLEEFETCLFAVGSILDSAWCERVKMKKSIWGSGDWGDPRFGRTHLDDCTLHAVRGPLTVRRLGLPEATPTGDPALLLPVLFPLSRQSDTGVIFIPHFNRRTAFSASAIASAGASRLVDFGVTRAERSACIQSIVDAEFVLTGSLHGAIVAQLTAGLGRSACRTASGRTNPANGRTGLPISGWNRPPAGTMRRAAAGGSRMAAGAP